MVNRVKEGIAQMANGNGENWRALWEWFWRLLSILVIPWAMWISATIVDVKTRVAVIEGNRFTAQDGYDLQRQLADRPTRDEVARNYPPPWLLQRLDKLELAFMKHTDKE